MIANDVEIIWRRLDELPRNGAIVVIAHDIDPLRWAYPAVCQATKMAEGKIIDQWSFTIEPFVHELA